MAMRRRDRRLAGIGMSIVLALGQLPVYAAEAGISTVIVEAEPEKEVQEQVQAEVQAPEAVDAGTGQASPDTGITSGQAVPEGDAGSGQTDAQGAENEWGGISLILGYRTGIRR